MGKTSRYDFIACHIERRKSGHYSSGFGRCSGCPDRYYCFTHIKVTKEDIEAYKTIPSFVCNVPNTEEGNIFFSQLKLYLNHDRYVVRRYGRATDRKAKGGNQSWTPIGNCDYFGVYLQTSNKIKRQTARQYRDKQEKVNGN